MDKKKLVIIAVAIMAVVLSGALVGVFFYSAPPKITLTYSSKYGNTQYSNYNTYILFYVNFTTTKNCQFTSKNLSVTCNGQPIATIAGPDGSPINLQSGHINSIELDYTVQGNVVGDFQLVYNGTQQVTLNGTKSVPVQS